VVRSGAVSVPIVLHQWEISPFCGKVRKVLDAKGLEYRKVDYNGLRALRAKRLSRLGKLPVLEHGTETVVDSSAIARFLEDRYPQPRLIPLDPRERHLCHFMEDWADEVLHWFEVYFRVHDPQAAREVAEISTQGRPAWERPVLQAGFKLRYLPRLRAQGIDKQERAEVEAAFVAHLDHVDGLLEGRDWLVSDERCLADIAVAAQLDEIERTSPFRREIRYRERLSAWLDRNR